MIEREGRNGGTLLQREKGDPALPGSGRKKNPFKDLIQAHASDKALQMITDGYLVEGDQVTDKHVKVMISVSSAEAVVMRMFRQAAKKGDVAAARWLSETGFGKTINLADDPDNPIGGGFAVILPSNNR